MFIDTCYSASIFFDVVRFICRAWSALVCITSQAAHRFNQLSISVLQSQMRELVLITRAMAENVQLLTARVEDIHEKLVTSNPRSVKR